MSKINKRRGPHGFKSEQPRPSLKLPPRAKVWRKRQSKGYPLVVNARYATIAWWNRTMLAWKAVNPQGRGEDLLYRSLRNFWRILEREMKVRCIPIPPLLNREQTCAAMAAPINPSAKPTYVAVRVGSRPVVEHIED